MIESPNTFFEQFQNFIEESGLQLKKFKSNLSNYFTKSEAIDTFLGKTDQAESAKKATQDSEGNVISSTYLTQTNASNTYLTKTGKASSANTADTATKATQDAKGNVIDNTYLTKTEASTTYLGKTAKASSAITADTATKATKDSDGNSINTTYVKSVNGSKPVNGDVTVDIPNSVHVGTEAPTDEEANVWINPEEGADKLVISVNDQQPDDYGNVYITSVEQATKDGSGNNIEQTYLKNSSIIISQTDLEAGVSPLPTGSIHFTYE